MLIAVLAAFAVGLAAPLATRPLAHRAGWVLALLPGGLTAYLLALAPAVRDGGALVQSVTWVPQLGVDAAFRLDGLSLLFALMITGIGTVITVYAGGYLHGDRQLPRFFLLLFAFMGAMLGVVLADDLITLFVFWELTSFTSYFLIGYGHEDAGSRANALQAMLVTAAGGLAMLAGFLMMGAAAGTFRISEILADPAALHASGWYLPMLALVAAGAFTKSAQFPFHFWLPNAMAAPTPVSAYLHSATMVKAGVYLLARTAPALGGTAAWTWLLVLAGAATVLAAAVLALLQRDAKRLLAYSTLIALGTLVLLIGIDTRYAATAMVVYMLAHALYKAPLFMVAGSLDHEAGTRDVTELAGVGRAMPATWIVALTAGLSAAGILPMLGFVGKELVYESLLSQPLPLAVLVAANAAMVMIVVLVAWRPFAGRTPRAPKTPHEAPPSMTSGPMALAGLGLLFGVAPALVQDGLLAPAAGAVHGAATGVSIYLWHGLTPALGLSVVTLLLGAVLTWRWRAVHLVLRRRYGELPFGPAQAYERTMAGLVRLAKWQTRVLQSNDLRHHLTIILSFAFGLTALTLAVKGGLRIAPTFTGGTVYEYLFLLITVVAALAVVRAHSRLEAITALGVVGFGIAFVFVLFAAPDLAITQFLVETLVVIIVALVLVRLPHALLREPVRDGVRALAGVVAVAGGILLTTLMLAVLSLPFDATLTTYFERLSYPAAHGRNIVNVILVDFRALDTLGEITVLAVAAAGAFSLLQRARNRPHPDAQSAAPGPFRSLASSRAAAAPMPAGRRDPDAEDEEAPGDPSERSDPPEEGAAR